MNHTVTRCPGLLMALVVLAVVAACGGAVPEDTATPAEAAAPPAAPTEAATAPAPPAPPVSAPEPAPPAASASDAIATEEHEVVGVEVELREIARARGDTLNLRWRYTNTTGEDKTLATGLGWYTRCKISADTYLIDPANQKKYLVITDAERRPVASSFGGDYEVTLAAGDSINSWAKFPAPPSDVTEIDIYIPGVIPFEGIPIRE